MYNLSDQPLMLVSFPAALLLSTGSAEEPGNWYQYKDRSLHWILFLVLTLPTEQNDVGLEMMLFERMLALVAHGETSCSSFSPILTDQFSFLQHNLQPSIFVRTFRSFTS